MDTLTHALSGALLGRATARKADHLSVRRRVAVGFLAGAFPDSDVIVRLFSDPLTFLNLHRGITHSVLLMPVWALLLAWLFALIWRERDQWRDYYGVALMSLAIHITGDVITAYGTKILAPFSDWKAGYPTTFIIDPWFTGIIVAGLLASLLWRRSRIPAGVGLAVLAGYVGFQATLYNQASEIGERYAADHGMPHAQVNAMPQPLSPFNWKIIVTEGDNYHITNLNLRRKESLPTPPAEAGFFTRIDAAYQPVSALHWQSVDRYGATADVQALSRELWQNPLLKGFRAFAEFPALAGIEQNSAGECVWYEDLRFVMKDIRSPFKFGLCKHADSDWGLYRLRDSIPEVIMP